MKFTRQHNVIGMLLAFALVLTMFTLTAAAQIMEGYVSTNNTGTTAARVIFPQNPEREIRLLSLDVKSDLAGSALNLYHGVAGFTFLATNNSSATTIVVNAGHALAANDFVVIQTPANAVAFGQVHSTNGTTNVNLLAAVGIACPSNTVVHRLSSASSRIHLGTNNVEMSGDPLFAAPRRQPLVVEVTGTSTSRVQRATAIYSYPAQ